MGGWSCPGWGGGLALPVRTGPSWTEDPSLELRVVYGARDLLSPNRADGGHLFRSLCNTASVSRDPFAPLFLRGGFPFS